MKPLHVAEVELLYSRRKLSRDATQPVPVALCSAKTQPGTPVRHMRRLSQADIIEIDELPLHDQVSVALMVLSNGERTSQQYAPAGVRTIAQATAGEHEIGPVYAVSMVAAMVAIRDLALDKIESCALRSGHRKSTPQAPDVTAAPPRMSAEPGLFARAPGRADPQSVGQGRCASDLSVAAGVGGWSLALFCVVIFAAFVLRGLGLW